jgi:hypothetical protein
MTEILALNSCKYFQDYSFIDSDSILSCSFIPRYDPSEQKSPIRQMMRLPISLPALRHLSSTYLIPSAFVEAALRRFKLKVCATVFRWRSCYVWEYWCLIPVRTNTACTASASEYATSTAVSNQMNPSDHIHLNGVGRDITPSDIGLHVQRDNTTGRLSVICFSLVEQRGAPKVEPWLQHIKVSLARRSKEELQRSPCFVLLLFIARVLREWEGVLLNFNAELIIHVSPLISSRGQETN